MKRNTYICFRSREVESLERFRTIIIPDKICSGIMRFITIYLFIVIIVFKYVTLKYIFVENKNDFYECNEA